MLVEVYKNTAYHWQPDIEVQRWKIPGYPIIVGGSLISADDYLHLSRKHNVRCVVNVETEHDDTGKVPPALLCQQQFEDNGQPIAAEKVRAIVAFVNRLSDGDKLNSQPFYVHCQMGGSRSPAIAYAILRGCFGLNRDAALEALNRGFAVKSDPEHPYGYHPVHQSYLASIDAALEATNA